MESNPLAAEIDNKSFISFLNQLHSKPLECIAGRNGVFMGEDEDYPFVLSQNGAQDLTKSDKTGNDFFESAKKDNPLDSFPKKEEVKPAESKKEVLPNEESSSFMDSFLIEFVHSIKNTLASIYHANVLSMEKYDDVEMRKRSHTQVEEGIKRMDSVLNSVLNFISINTPIVRTNTLYVILEEILEANEKQLRKKNIKIIKRCEKELPETFIHPEQVRFILNSILQYAILSTPPNETIGLLMKSFDFHDGPVAEKTSPENHQGYIEMMIGFNEDRKPVNQLENLPDAQRDQKEGMIDLILKLTKEVLQKNHGMMIETHGKTPKTLITLRFPMERRKVVYYAPIAL